MKKRTGPLSTFLSKAFLLLMAGFALSASPLLAQETALDASGLVTEPLLGAALPASIADKDDKPKGNSAAKNGEDEEDEDDKKKEKKNEPGVKNPDTAAPAPTAGSATGNTSVTPAAPTSPAEPPAPAPAASPAEPTPVPAPTASPEKPAAEAPAPSTPAAPTPAAPTEPKAEPAPAPSTPAPVPASPVPASPVPSAPVPATPSGATAPAAPTLPAVPVIAAPATPAAPADKEESEKKKPGEKEDGATFSLEKGESRNLPGGYTLSYPSQGSGAKAEIRLFAAGDGSADFFSTPAGFETPVMAIEIKFEGKSGDEGGSAGATALRLTSPAGRAADLQVYRLRSGKKPLLLATGPTADLAGNGVYAVARDTEPPRLRFEGARKVEGDSTEVSFTVEDNVENLTCRFHRSDRPAAKTASAEWAAEESQTLAGTTLRYRLKNRPGEYRPLLAGILVTDGRYQIRYPAAGGAEALPQSVTSFASPAILRTANGKVRWDLVSLPLQGAAGVSVETLERLNPVGKMAVLMHDGKGGFSALNRGEPLPAGRSFWLTSEKPLDKLQLPAFSFTPKPGDLDLKLKPGWNHVSAPYPEAFSWPADREKPGYEKSRLKGLLAFDPASGDYEPRSEMEPWRGYLVYYHGSSDTVIRLLPVRPAVGAPAKAVAALSPFRDRVRGGAPKLSAPAARSAEYPLAVAETPNQVQLVFHPLGKGGRAMPLQLGALPQGQDRVDIEDELQPPLPAGASAAYADRQSHRLGSDFLRFAPGTLLAWKIIVHPSGREEPEARLGLWHSAQSLPKGYTAVAISQARKRSISLAPGDSLLVPSRQGDTLLVYAGPAALVKKTVAFLAEEGGAFALRASALKGGQLGVSLALPQGGSVRLRLLSADGKAGEWKDSGYLPPGRYDWRYPLEGSFRSAQNGWSALEAEFRGEGLPRRHVTPLTRTASPRLSVR